MSDNDYSELDNDRLKEARNIWQREVKSLASQLTSAVQRVFEIEKEIEERGKRNEG